MPLPRSLEVRFELHMAKHANQRRGVETLELILVLPLLITLLIAGIQFSTVLVVDTTLLHASIEASRLAAMGCDGVEIASRTDEFLAVHGLVLGAGIRLVVEDAAGLLHSFGDGTLTSTSIGTPVVLPTSLPCPPLLPSVNWPRTASRRERIALNNWSSRSPSSGLFGSPALR